MLKEKLSINLDSINFKEHINIPNSIQPITINVKKEGWFQTNILKSSFNKIELDTHLIDNAKIKSSGNCFAIFLPTGIHKVSAFLNLPQWYLYLRRISLSLYITLILLGLGLWYYKLFLITKANLNKKILTYQSAQP